MVATSCRTHLKAYKCLYCRHLVHQTESRFVMKKKYPGFLYREEKIWYFTAASQLRIFTVNCCLSESNIWASFAINIWSFGDKHGVFLTPAKYIFKSFCLCGIKWICQLLWKQWQTELNLQGCWYHWRFQFWNLAHASVASSDPKCYQLVRATRSVHFKCNRQRVRPITSRIFLPFPNVFYGLFATRKREINTQGSAAGCKLWRSRLLHCQTNCSLTPEPNSFLGAPRLMLRPLVTEPLTRTRFGKLQMRAHLWPVRLLLPWI